MTLLVASSSLSYRGPSVQSVQKAVRVSRWCSDDREKPPFLALPPATETPHIFFRFYFVYVGDQPVTVEANGSIDVRSQSADSPHPVEVLLRGSHRFGEPIRVNTNREFLSRALGLGFRRIHFVSPEAPTLCQDDSRSCVWALLGSDGAVQSTDKAVRIEPSDYQVSPLTTDSKRTNVQSVTNREKKPRKQAAYSSSQSQVTTVDRRTIH